MDVEAADNAELGAGIASRFLLNQYHSCSLIRSKNSLCTAEVLHVPLAHLR